MKKRLAFMIIGGLLVILLFWFGNHSFINIRVADADTGQQTTYIIINQKNDKKIEISTSSNSIKRFVTRGSYEIWVRQSDSSYFSVVSTKGFGTSTVVDAKLTPEKDRKYVGDNPAQCVFYTGSTLASYTCSGLSSEIGVHLPATATHPTYIQKVDSEAFPYGYVQGTVATKEGLFILIQPSSTDESGKGYELYRVDRALKVSSKTALSSLDKSKSYAIQPFRSGFIIYDQSLSSAYYYSSSGAKPEEIHIPEQSDKTLVKVDTQIDKNQIVVLYGKQSNAKPQKPKAQVVIFNGTGSNQFTFKKDYFGATVCGTNKLCMLSAKNMDVYDITEAKPKYLYMLSGVATNMVDTEKGLLLINTEGILNFDVESRQGFAEYTFGSYVFNSITKVPRQNSYVVSLTDSKGRKVALLIDQGKNVIEAIDKQVQALLRLSQVNNVSANGNYIYISPNLGGLVYNESLHLFDYDPVAKKAANTAINQAIKDQHINTGLYKIVNTKQ